MRYLSSRNPSYCIILDSLVFNDFTLTDDLFVKALRKLETGLSVNPISFGEEEGGECPTLWFF